jgi:trk system potassium uptake protein
MDAYNAVSHALTTMPTGGFSPQGRSIEAFGAWAQWIIIVFMAIAGASFVLWYRTIRRDVRTLVRDEEFRLYLAVLIGASALIALWLGTRTDPSSRHDAWRHATFQVTSVVTTTGYASAVPAGLRRC